MDGETIIALCGAGAVHIMATGPINDAFDASPYTAGVSDYILSFLQCYPYSVGHINLNCKTSVAGGFNLSFRI